MGGSKQSRAATEAQYTSASQAQQLNNLALPAMEHIMSTLGAKFGTDWGKVPGEITRSYDKIRSDTEASFQQAQFGSAESARYLARTSGAPMTGGELSGVIANDAYGLDQQRRQTLGQIKLEEANAAMTANNGFMRLMMGAGQSALGLANANQSMAMGGIGGMSSSNPWQSALAGAAAGASAGSVVPGWGTAIGAVVGGVGGYMAGR